MGIVLQAAHLHGHHTNSQPPNSVIPPGRPPPTKENNRKEDGHRIQPLPASRARSRIFCAFEPAANEEGGVEGGGGEVVTRADGGGGHGGDKEGLDESSLDFPLVAIDSVIIVNNPYLLQC